MANKIKMTLGGLVADGLATELDYMTSDEAERAIALESELLADGCHVHET